MATSGTANGGTSVSITTFLRSCFSAWSYDIQRVGALWTVTYVTVHVAESDFEGIFTLISIDSLVVNIAGVLDSAGDCVFMHDAWLKTHMWTITITGCGSWRKTKSKCKSQRLTSHPFCCRVIFEQSGRSPNVVALFSATIISCSIIWLLRMLDTIRMKSNYIWISYKHDNIAI